MVPVSIGFKLVFAYSIAFLVCKSYSLHRSIRNVGYVYAVFQHAAGALNRHAKYHSCFFNACVHSVYNGSTFKCYAVESLLAFKAEGYIAIFWQYVKRLVCAYPDSV